MTKYLIQCALRRSLWLLVALCLFASAHGQVVGLQPTPIGLYTWNPVTNQWDQVTTSNTAAPAQNTPQAFAFYEWNPTLEQWVPCQTGGACFGGSSSTVNVNGSEVSNPNFNGSTPAPDSGYTPVTWKVSGSSVLGEVPSSASGSGALGFIPLWTPNGTTLGDSHLDDGITNSGQITSSETIHSVVSGQDVPAFFGTNNGTSTLHVDVADFMCPNITTSTVSGCVLGVGMSTALEDAGGIAIEFRYGGSTSANRGALSMGTTITDNQEALMWDWAGNVYLPQLPNLSSLATDANGKIIPGAGGGVAWPASGDLVLSNGSSSPAGLAPVNGDCVVGAGGAWTAASCGSGSSGFPITLGATSVAASSTTTAINGLGTLQQQIYLNCSSDLGAQFNAADATLAAGSGGVIWWPNGTNCPMSTTAVRTNSNISVRGYGLLGSTISCTVAGDCFRDAATYTNVDSVSGGGEISNFSINGNGATGQVLYHAEDALGESIHDIALDGANGTGGICMEFENVTHWTERNHVQAQVGSSCTQPVEFNQDAGDANVSFGYNHFLFELAPQSVYGLSFIGNGQLYNGSLTLTVDLNFTGTGGGVMQFANSFSVKDEMLALNAETFSNGTIFNIGASNVVNFQGWVNNGGFGGVLPTYCTGSCTSANLTVTNPLATYGSVTGTASAVATDTDTATTAAVDVIPRQELCSALATTSNCILAIGRGTSGFDNGFLSFNGPGGTANSLSLLLSGMSAPGLSVFGNGNVAIPAGALNVGGSTFTPSTSVASFTGNWGFGTGVTINNTSAGGHSWSMSSEGASETPGIFFFVDNTNTAYPLTMFSSSSTATKLLTNKSGTYAFSSTDTPFNNGSNQQAGFSSPASGVLSADTSTAGDGLAEVKMASILPGVLYSAAGTALPACAAGNKGLKAVVSDATSPTYLGTYTSGGAVVSPVICNGSGWVTY